MRKLIVTIDPKYVNYIITVDASGKTTVRVSIDKTGLPENAKKVNISYIYLKKEYTIPGESESEEPIIEPEPSPSTGDEDAPQPAAGTITTVGERIDIDENTEYPIVGEFEIDGIPASIEGEVNTVSKSIRNPASHEFGTNGSYYELNLTDSEDENSFKGGQLEWIPSNGTTPFDGGIAIRGSKIND